MANSIALFARSAGDRTRNFMGRSHLVGDRWRETLAQSLLVTLFTILGTFAAEPFEEVGGAFYFPNKAAWEAGGSSNWLVVGINESFGFANFNYNQVSSGGGDGATRMDGSSKISHGTPEATMTVNGITFSIYPLVVTSVGGNLYTDSGGGWLTVGTHGSNLVADFQQQYIDWIGQMRGQGYAVNISNGSFRAFLQGLQTVPENESQGTGGTPGPIIPNPQGGNATTTTTGSNTVTTSSGNATVTTTNSNTYTYTYNYTTNNTTNEGTGEIDLSGVIGAIGASTDVIGGKIDLAAYEAHADAQEISGKLDDVIDAIGTGGGGGGGGPAGAPGIDYAAAPDLAAAVDGAATTGANAANSKFGALTSTMALTGQGNHAFTLDIPWVGGGTQSYTMNTLPEVGSPLDGLRLIVRIFLTVCVGLGFMYLCVKTLRTG